MDFVLGCLCLSIGCAVAWLMALYTSRGERMLIGDTFAGIAGAALAAIVLWWTAPVYVVVGLLILGPVLAWLAIGVADLVRRSLSGRHLPG